MYDLTYLNTSEGYLFEKAKSNDSEQNEQEDSNSSDELQPKNNNDPTMSTLLEFRVRFCKPELTLQDVATICQSFTARNDVFRPKWFRFARFDKQSRMILARITVSEKFLNKQFSKLKFAGRFFPKDGVPVVKEALDSEKFWEAMLNVKIDKFAKLRDAINKDGDSLKKLRLGKAPNILRQNPHYFQQQADQTFNGRGETLRQNGSLPTRKVDLLTTMSQMIYMFYPMEGFEGRRPPNIPPIRNTKKRYSVITEKSPLFFLDTEMCLTNVQLLELTRVTLLNQNGEIIIDTFVKPKNKIIDYLTFYSGVTEQAMQMTDVTLEEVQDAFCRVLPPDAILCGHSIEGDLRALRLSHPFCIDTSYIYNLTKYTKRTSLRGLSYFFLNKRIQCTDMGHCSYQDASIVLKLVQLKLSNNRDFGVAQYGFNYTTWARNNGLEKCAESFESSNVKDVARDEYRKLSLPAPRKVGECERCRASLVSQCFINDCICSANHPKFCCRCVGHNMNFIEPFADEVFAFGKELERFKSDFNHNRSIPLHVCLRDYEDRARVLVARYLKEAESMYHMSTKNVTTFDMNSYDEIGVFRKYVLNANAESVDLCLLEYAGLEESSKKVGDYIHTLHKEAPDYTVIGVLLCTETKSLLYANTKVPSK